MAAEDRNGEVVSTQGECPDCSTRESSFDELAKGLANGKLTRRKALRMLGGALLGGALASIPRVAWAAKGGTTTGPCRPGEFRCGPQKGKFVCCPEVASCVQGRCVCPNGGAVCPGNTGSNTCVDSATDPLNCGGCGKSCAAGAGCCNGNCTNLSTALNCGSCGNACSGGKTCQSGACACPQGQTACGGVCRDLTTDVANCGICGNVCAQGASCVGGTCHCPSGQTLCGGQCVGDCPPPTLLNTNCQCQCPANETCTSSGGTLNPTTCECECPAGKVLCNGACVTTCQPPQFLNADCQCECPTDVGCTSTGGTVNPTTCVCECPGGKTVCGGRCVEVCAPPKVVLNTGTCQCECPANQACTGSGGTVNPNTCQCQCPGGKTLCQGQCVTSCDPTTGEVLNPSTCQCESTCPQDDPSCDGTCCPGTGPSHCGCEGGCGCFFTAEGSRACVSALCSKSSGPSCDRCTSTAQCPAGFTCVSDPYLLRQAGLCPGATSPTSGGIICNSDADCPEGTTCVPTTIERGNTKYCCTAGLCFHNCSLTTPPYGA